MACCKPLPHDLQIQIDPACFCGTSGEESDGKETNEDKKFDEHFICGICQNVIIDAEECSKCQNCFCQKCINKWKQTSTNFKSTSEEPIDFSNPSAKYAATCPMCKEDYTGAPLHRYRTDNRPTDQQNNTANILY